ncbi:MAG: thioesterase family protein [Psychrobacter sp.]|nr:thioesterase family protein [Psychrobacter sp.]
MTAYYQCLYREQQADGVVLAQYRPTIHAQGAWNDHEQHMAPATGVITHELTQFSPNNHMRIARISLDILGLIPLDEFTVTTRLIRPGKTIELIESVMSSGGRDCISARAWRLMTQDTSAIAGLEDHVATHLPNQLPDWDEIKGWPGGFIQSVRLVSDPQRRAGKGMVWITTDVEMVEGERTADLVHLLGLVDTANGVVPRTGLGLAESGWMFPNTDLQIHMHRAPQGRWLGIEAVQQYGTDGIGLTSAVLHDVSGPFGRSEQILTVRPIPR